VIYVSKDQLEQVEYLISQSIQGNHVLFDPAMVRKIFESTGEKSFADSDAYSVEHHIERLIEEPSLEAKKAYLESLDHETLERVVRTYFNIVENNLFENDEVRH
jgi:hypothetical protein